MAIKLSQPATDLLWGVTRHPDAPMRGRPEVRHLIRLQDGKTLCGHRVVWRYDYATPLLDSCQRCVRLLAKGTIPTEMRRK